MHLSKISLALRQWGAGAWSPSSLFASGEQGVWLDPSDLTTMFQDRAGTTQVTADGQTVGLILDKSKGLALGPELVTNGNFSVGTGWTLSGTTTISGGLLNAASLGSEFIATQSVPFVSGKTYELTIVVPTITSGNVSVVYGVGTNVTAITVVSSGTFKSRVAAGSGNSELRLVSSGSGFTGTIDNISIKELPGNHATAPNDSARPQYKTSGGLHWLQFDGVNNSLSTAAINFSSTDEMSIFCGVHKNSGNATGFICEFSDNINNNNGSLFLAAPLNTITNDDYNISSKGTTYSGGSRVVVLSPDTSVLSCICDISAPLNRLYRNTVQAADFTASQGTGNYGNYPLYIGSRGSSSLFIDGNIYSLIIRGTLSTTQEITDAETWVNSKTGAY